MVANSAIPTENIRHNLDPFLVMNEINLGIERNQKLRLKRKAEITQMHAEFAADVANGTAKKKWLKPPIDIAYYEVSFDRLEQRERDLHSTVRVIELPIKGKRFILVYGDLDDATVTLGRGTGPFKTFQNAADFFLGGGR